MQVIIDERLNKEIENYFISLGYEIIKVKKHNELYSEISSHTDIFCLKIGDTIVQDKDAYSGIIDEKYNIIYGDKVDKDYPACAKYNVCLIDNYAIHNFDITDKKILELLKDDNYKLINVRQGYSRCSILPLGNKCCITSDKGIYDTLKKNDFDVLYIDSNELDIKLYKEDGIYSEMKGFIGGATAVMNDTVIFFGDMDKLVAKDKLKSYIISKGFNIKDFKNMDIIDYGSCIFLN